MAAGFVDFEITWQADVFSGAPQASSAAEFGTQGINFRARKAANEEEWQRRWPLSHVQSQASSRHCRVPMPSQMQGTQAKASPEMPLEVCDGKETGHRSKPLCHLLI